MSTTWISRRSLLLGAAVLLVLAAAVGGVLNRAQAATIQGNVFVSPTGDDANAGTQAAPVKTVQRAQALVRGLNGN